MKDTNERELPEDFDAPVVPKPGWKARISALSAVRQAVEIFRKETPKLTRNGAYDIGSDNFRQACAVLDDGTVCVVRTYNTAEISVELARLRQEWRLPPETGRKSVTLAQMREYYGYVSEARVTHEETSGQLRLIKAIAEAAALGASDIKLVQRSSHGELRIKVGAGEFNHGPQWKFIEVKEAVHWIHGHRDGGDGQPTLVEGKPAQFSIGQADRLKHMPENVDAFRGQIAWPGDINYFLNLRFLYAPRSEDYGNVAGLGLEDDILEALGRERRSESGLVIIGGSTGDGKSTTLVRNLERLYQERNGEVSLYTIEDPIEYPTQGGGVVQFSVQGGNTPEERKANYSKMLMTFVRTNPDIGMISEIRSVDDVNEVLHFVTSGHKIYTTVHASSANAVLFRLISLGVRPAELSGPDVVNMVMRQKLVPVLCSSCAEPLEGAARDKVMAWLDEVPLYATYAGDVTARPLRRNRTGCDVCRAPYKALPGAAAETAKNAWAGYTGRRATAELIDLDDEYRKLVNDHRQLEAKEYWLTPKSDGGMGGISVPTRVARLIAQGVTDYEHYTNDILEVTNG